MNRIRAGPFLRIIYRLVVSKYASGLPTLVHAGMQIPAGSLLHIRRIKRNAADSRRIILAPRMLERAKE